MTDEHSTAARLRRAPVVRIYDVGDTTVLLGPDGVASELRGPSAELARAVLGLVLRPCTRAELLAQLERLTGAAIDDTRVIDELLALLEARGALVRDAGPPARAPCGTRARLVLAICGAIASAFTPGLVALLQARGFEVRVVATEAALRFVGVEALEALVHHPVRSSLWPEGSGMRVPHLELGRWADAVLVAPATATTLARLAGGDHSNLVSALALSTRAPVVLVPSMNVDMYAEPAVQRNLETLVADGFYVVHPGSGHEVADSPSARRSMLGPAPPDRVIVELLAAILRRAGPREPQAPRDADEWDALFRTKTPAELAWQVEELDGDMLEALRRVAPSPAQVLDLGTGLGVAARAAAGLGHRVVATDISAAALARAREHADAGGIVWLRDDVTDSRLSGEFEVVLDRACLHLLPSERAPAYAAAVARLTAPGGALILKTHDPGEGASRGTTPFDAAGVLALLGDAFELESDTPSTIPGPDVAPAARLFVLRRKPKRRRA
jgi:SAM-dependent methyltransferase